MLPVRRLGVARPCDPQAKGPPLDAAQRLRMEKTPADPRTDLLRLKLKNKTTTEFEL